MNGESVERLMDIILQMKINMVHISETVYQQTREIREQLEAIFEDEKKALELCLSGIDDKLKECAVHVEDYKRLYANLAMMHERLVKLGAEPAAMPCALPKDRIEGVVAWRIEELKRQGKI